MATPLGFSLFIPDNFPIDDYSDAIDKRARKPQFFISLPIHPFSVGEFPMKLTYRGACYTVNTPSVETVETPLKGGFLGAYYQIKSARGARPQRLNRSIFGNQV